MVDTIRDLWCDRLMKKHRPDGDSGVRSIDEILTELGSLQMRLSETDLNAAEIEALKARQQEVRAEAALAREAMPVDRDRALARVYAIDRLVDQALARHLDPSMAASSDRSGGIDPYILVKNNARIDREAGLEELRHERRRLVAQLTRKPAG